MSWVATAIVATTTVYQTQQNKKAQREAKRDALEADKQARKAEVFAETEGEGTGQLGQVRLDVDDELEEDEDTSTVLSI
jgi:hypothetical protein